METTIVIPAYNEEQTVGGVVKAAVESGLFIEVIVVDDGSNDNSARVAEEAGAKVIRVQPNQGKANAMRRGAEEATGDIILYWDSDLISSSTHHFQQVIQPILDERVHMCIGVLDSFGQRVAPDWSGERALKTSLMREFFEHHPNIQRFSVEQKLTNWAKRNKWIVVYEHLTGIRHRQKEEKRGFLVGFLDRLKMYLEIIWGR